ncbi:hypothetical protein RKE29_21175 [Streptomyces sp. B1866]|uniref:hypothetical protein n=1 Tax=Streptomyces sp. B1866 TaxID=3075431 RepID=UPI00288F6F2B|nr:hypothetical protein [Streptomyces sp. B1866]MDT3399126.1 hypothetical protein [Streptomyces sp. B1866]
MHLTKHTWPRAAAAAVVLALPLTACGSDDDSDGASPPGASASATSAGAPPGTTPAPTPSTAQSAEQDPAQGAGSTAGGQLKPGQAGVRAFEERDGVTPTYEIAAQKIVLGTHAEAEKMVSNPARAAGMVPAVAYVTYTHKSGPAVEKYPRVGDYAYVYADGRRGAKLIGVVDEPAGCTDSNDVKNWRPGQSYVLCTTYFVPENATSLEIQWTEIGGEPFVWKFPKS